VFLVSEPQGNMTMKDALSLCSVSKSFGAFLALDSVDFAVKPGEVHALLGENEAGKSTPVNIACGLYAPDEGHIGIDGKSVTLAGARDAAAMGIGMAHQHFKLVSAFSVLENIMLFNPRRPAAQVARVAGASRLLIWTGLSQPARKTCAMPRASVRSVLFLIVQRAALT
jgi:ABC-type uncharacterized transport system ATPase subunit